MPVEIVLGQSSIVERIGQCFDGQLVGGQLGVQLTVARAKGGRPHADDGGPITQVG
jgi:hypothetical protein